MKTINKRVEELEERHETKPIMVLWGDWDDKTICHIGGMKAAETMPWEDAIARFESNNTLICVNYVEGMKP
jgi:hypothetical protein